MSRDRYAGGTGTLDPDAPLPWDFITPLSIFPRHYIQV